VPPYLSEEWIEALDRAVAASDELRAAADPPLAVGYRVHDAGSGDSVDYHVRLDPAGCSAGTGTADADVVFETDRATASAVAGGELRAQRAFMAGRIRARGDVRSLLDRADALAVLATLSPPPTGDSAMDG